MTYTYFLQTDFWIKQRIRKQKQLAQDESIKSRDLLPYSVGMAICSTMMVMPVDCAKTQKQKFKQDKASSYKDIVQRVYREAGIQGFYVGWRLRLLTYLLHSVVTVDILERLEAVNRKIRN